MIKCPQCGAPNAPGSQNCASCGVQAVFPPQTNMPPQQQTQQSPQSPPKKSSNTLLIIILIFACAILSCVGCGLIGAITEKLDPNKNTAAPNAGGIKPAPKKPESQAVINIPQLANMSPEEVDQILGKPKNITPGKEKNKSYRSYAVANIDDPVEIIFEDNKAVQFDILLAKENKVTPQKYAQLAGFEVTGVNPAEQSLAKTEWKGNFSGVDFYSIIVMDTTLTARVLDDKTRAEMELIGDKPKPNPFDGRVAPVVEYLKANLNDYDNSQFVKWYPVVKTSYKGQACWGVKMQLKAKNAFGAYVSSMPFFYIQKGQVIAVEGLK